MTRLKNLGIIILITPETKWTWWIILRGSVDTKKKKYMNFGCTMGFLGRKNKKTKTDKNLIINFNFDGKNNSNINERWFI